MHAGRAMIRSTSGRAFVMPRQGLPGRPRDLMDGGVHRDVRRGVRSGSRGRLSRGGSEQALGVGVGVRYGSGAGVRGRRPHAADLSNLTRGSRISH